jgi:hypothetical protein
MSKKVTMGKESAKKVQEEEEQVVVVEVVEVGKRKI